MLGVSNSPDTRLFTIAQYHYTCTEEWVISTYRFECMEIQYCIAGNFREKKLTDQEVSIL